MSKQFYFEKEDSEFCYTIDYFRDKSDPEEKEITIYKAIPLNDDTFFWCRSVDEVGTNGDCGKFCSDYAPKNGKSGMCKFKGRLYTHGEKITIKL